MCCWCQVGLVVVGGWLAALVLGRCLISNEDLVYDPEDEAEDEEAKADGRPPDVVLRRQNWASNQQERSHKPKKFFRISAAGWTARSFHFATIYGAMVAQRTAPCYSFLSLSPAPLRPAPPRAHAFGDPARS